MKVFKSTRLWYYRTFCTISKSKATKLGLTFHRNVYGDAINHLNCRSLWKDSKGRQYRVESLNYINS